MKSLLIKITRRAGTFIKKNINTSFSTQKKEGVNNLVTDIDKSCEALIVSAIKKQFPTHSILSEEMGAVNGSAPYTWIIDPIDGTMNFSQGIPLCAVSVALSYKREVVMGAVFNPFLREFFFSEKGSGAYLNGTPIRVNTLDDLEHSCLVTGFSYLDVNETKGTKALPVFEMLVKKGIPVRRIGSAAINICWVAAGRFGAYYQFSKLNIWDMAAAKLILEEAGGRFTNVTEDNTFDVQIPGLIASNNYLHGQMLHMIRCV